MSPSTFSHQRKAQAVAAALANWALANPAEVELLVEGFNNLESGRAIPGYEAYFRDHTALLQPRVLGWAVHKCGNTLFMERIAERVVSSHLRSIARGGSALVTSRRAHKLSAECARGGQASDVLQRACASSKLDHFPKLLDDAIRKDERACADLTSAASALAGHLRAPQGREPRIESVTHELLLAGIKGLDKPQAYTNDIMSGEFTDPRTAATCRAFGLDRFDPRPARRRVNERALST